MGSEHVAQWLGLDAVVGGLYSHGFLSCARVARGVVATVPSRTRQQQSGEGDVVELAQVAQLVLDGDAMRAGPAF